MQQVKALFIKLKAELRDNTLPALARKSAAATAELTGDTTPAAGGGIKSSGAAAAAADALQKQGVEPNARLVRGLGASGHHHSHAPVANGKVLTSLPVSLVQLKMSIANGKVAGIAAGTGAAAVEAAGVEDGEESRPLVLLLSAVAASAEGEVKKLQATLESNGCTIR
jgi:hypothetical protein